MPRKQPEQQSGWQNKSARYEGWTADELRKISGWLRAFGDLIDEAADELDKINQQYGISSAEIDGSTKPRVAHRNMKMFVSNAQSAIAKLRNEQRFGDYSQ